MLRLVAPTFEAHPASPQRPDPTTALPEPTMSPDNLTQTAESTAPQAAVDGKGILITEPAMKQLAALMRQQGEDKVLRVGVRSGGCSGMSYTMDFIEADQILPDDEQIHLQTQRWTGFSGGFRSQESALHLRHAARLLLRPDRRRLQLHQSQRQPDLRLRQFLRRLGNTSGAVATRQCTTAWEPEGFSVPSPGAAMTASQDSRFDQAICRYQQGAAPEEIID